MVMMDRDVAAAAAKCVRTRELYTVCTDLGSLVYYYVRSVGPADGHAGWPGLPRFLMCAIIIWSRSEARHRGLGL
jgi:hypothetical protein